MANKRAQVGIVRGLAWTAVGGETLEVEVGIMPGNGKLMLTGKLGDVMKESAQIALTYVRSQTAKLVKDNVAYFGYGYIKDVNELVPNVPLTFYMFRVMVMLGGYFILFFIVVLFLAYKKDLSRMPWMHWVAMLTIPLGYLAGQAGWVVAECGRQPWAIQDMLPTSAAISKLDVGSVQTTFFIFLVLFTVMLIAEVGIMLKAIRKGPETETHNS